MKKVAQISLFLSLFLFSSKAFASGECTPLYGGGYTCPKSSEIIIDKQIKNPTNDLFVDNLTQFDPKFAPSADVTFRIFVRNTGDQTFDRVEIKDILPDYLSFVSGPGNFNASEGKNGTLTFTLYNLAGGESREYWVWGRVFASQDIPKDLICKLQNRAQARTTGDRFNEDIAEYCIEKTAGVTKGGLSVTEVPKTGPEAILSFIGLSSLLGAGVYLRRKAASILN